jgi:hypothetical protein
MSIAFCNLLLLRMSHNTHSGQTSPDKTLPYTGTARKASISSVSKRRDIPKFLHNSTSKTFDVCIRIVDIMHKLFNFPSSMCLSVLLPTITFSDNFLKTGSSWNHRQHVFLMGNDDVQEVRSWGFKHLGDSIPQVFFPCNAS